MVISAVGATAVGLKPISVQFLYASAASSKAPAMVGGLGVDDGSDGTRVVLPRRYCGALDDELDSLNRCRLGRTGVAAAASHQHFGQSTAATAESLLRDVTDSAYVPGSISISRSRGTPQLSANPNNCA